MALEEIAAAAPRRLSSVRPSGVWGAAQVVRAGGHWLGPTWPAA